MKDLRKVTFCSALVLLVVTDVAAPTGALAGPSAEVARKCLHFSYIAYPYQRPGAVKMSGDRQAYFRDCMTKDGNVPEPAEPSKAQ
ncbi:hypothetical protein [Bradyrhizobium sp. BR 10289]|uniref:hypothetical protein n=1 Tax=Bradyrhizobium sp. BR 10289 TaxID=2749993 RepID=UPI001C646F6A|nr:hypothetical protein [Bradyrhizobium sp. BR 10289]MBW7971575.1 hypothetical protein [Bradyrhizobium sp. BR 10289]